MQQATNKKVLLIDDDSFIRGMYKKGLERGGFSVDEAEDGDGGLQKIKSERFDIVFLDMVLPDMSGTELLKKVREQGQFAKLPMVVLSSLSQPEKMREAMDAGANKYAIKDRTTPKGLIAIIGELTKA